ncbi:MAG TPA: phosphoglucosamine mutase [Bryobacteraceae bacterium]|jgi:phosphoglucosamine mutase|nr:phosphoglucosamine mutase [Bryobacteraceae bacterium]
MRQLFGTDGIRGTAGEYPLDRPTTFAVGVALAQWIGTNHLNPEVVLGMDTRQSGPWIAEHVAGGLAQGGVRARSAGLISTPGLAYIAKTGPFAAGVMISASHNPFQDNGIKIFDHSGFKLPDQQEHTIEGYIFASASSGKPPSPQKLTVDEGLDRAYVEHLAATMPGGLAGMTIVVDGANGAATHLGPALFERLGAKVDRIHCAPDGKNINLNSGALHVEGLRKRVLETGATLGVAFDGDADRAMFVSHSGKIVDGDGVLLLAARRLQVTRGLKEVVSTVMSNLGLERALAHHGIGMVRTPVGDKYVLEEMIKRDALLGGEQSGHVIFREFATTGDGLLTALRVCDAMRTSGQDLDALTAELEIYPQLLVNVRVKERRPLEDMATVKEEIRRMEAEFGNTGRVVVRFSGTEPLARVMVEGPKLDRVEHFAESIAAAIRSELG